MYASVNPCDSFTHYWTTSKIVFLSKMYRKVTKNSIFTTPADGLPIGSKVNY